LHSAVDQLDVVRPQLVRPADGPLDGPQLAGADRRMLHVSFQEDPEEAPMAATRPHVLDCGSMSVHS
jgi:hypothetical protein